MKHWFSIFCFEYRRQRYIKVNPFLAVIRAVEYASQPLPF